MYLYFKSSKVWYVLYSGLHKMLSEVHLRAAVGLGGKKRKFLRWLANDSAL